MVYRLVMLVGALILVGLFVMQLWWLCRTFLSSRGFEGASLDQRALNLATWTFAGFAAGLPFFAFGALLLGPWAFYRNLRDEPGVSELSANALFMRGFGYILAALVVTGAVCAGFLYVVGAV